MYRNMVYNIEGIFNRGGKRQVWFQGDERGRRENIKTKQQTDKYEK